MEFLQLIAMAQEAEQPITDQVGGGLLPPDHGHDGVGNHFLLAEAISLDFGGQQCCDKSFSWMAGSLTYGGPEVGDHLFQAAHDAGRSFGRMLEVAEHLGKVG